MQHTGNAHKVTHKNKPLTGALTSTRFLQHSQTGAASFRNIVCLEYMPNLYGSSYTFQIQEVQQGTKCAGPSSAPTGM